MSLWDLRRAIESAVPWWAPLAVVAGTFALAFAVHWIVGKDGLK